MVNEGLHGSVTHLQSEIKRLREVISKYEKDGVPQNTQSEESGLIIMSTPFLYL